MPAYWFMALMIVCAPVAVYGVWSVVQLVCHLDALAAERTLAEQMGSHDESNAWQLDD